MESGEDYANPRNLASGSLTLKDADEVKARHIQWIPFTLVYTEEDITSWGERMDWLDRQGFNTVERRQLEHPDLSAVEACIAGFTAEVTSKQNPYPVDGLVVCYDDTAYAQTGSVTGHHATRAGLAFKWQDEAADTILKEVEWSCAASTISPVAVFQPVELEGSGGDLKLVEADEAPGALRVHEPPRLLPGHPPSTPGGTTSSRQGTRKASRGVPGGSP
jgi:DNA ligase (NAD+)